MAPQRTQAKVVEILVMDFGWNMDRSIEAVKKLYETTTPSKYPTDSVNTILNKEEK